jgi:hypothetical protein
MKKHLLVICSAVAIAGPAIAAQQPQPLTPPTQQTPPSQPAQRPPDPATTTPTPATREASPMADMAKTATTVTGCLKTWDSRTMAPATGAGSGAGSAASAVTAPSGSAQYVLSNIDRTGAASRPAASSFLLKTSDSSVSFSQHLNHKVELTGTLSDAASKPADKPSAERDASASGRVTADDMKLPTLNVTALKMVSPTCGTGSN